MQKKPTRDNLLKLASSIDVARMAQLGAPVRLRELDDERAAILAMFPDIEHADRQPTIAVAATALGKAPRRYKRSKAFRDAVRKRSVAYWKSPKGKARRAAIKAATKK